MPKGTQSQYQAVVDSCLRRRVLFEDPDFPAENSSLYYSQPPTPFPITWKRPREITSQYGEEPRFIDGGVSRFDLNQGELGDCWVVAALACITEKPDIFNKVVPEGQGFTSTENYCGVMRFRFFRFGRWVEVIIDDKLPTYQGQLIYIQSTDNKEFWSPLVEKAYAKLAGSYESLRAGLMRDALDNFTGGLTETIVLTDRAKVPSNLQTYLFKSFERGSLIGAGISSKKDNKLPNGLVAGHAYTVTDIRKLPVLHGNRKVEVTLVRIRNPWGNEKEWNGPWSDRSAQWNELSEQDRKIVGLIRRDDGEFWMSWNDFLSNFDQVDLCHLPPEEKPDAIKLWNVQKFYGSWQRDRTAGGQPFCRNTFHLNPQYYVRLVDSDLDDDNIATCIIGVAQKDNRISRGAIEYKSIGFVVFHLPSPNLIGKPLDKDFFERSAHVASCNFFTKSRSNVKRCELQPGDYIIVPCTFNINEEAEFVLQVFTETESNAAKAPPSALPTL